MQSIENLQYIWQNQEIKPAKSWEAISLSVLQKIKSTEKLICRLNSIKTIALVLILAAFVYLIRYLDYKSMFIYLGAGIILLATLFFMVIYWRNQFSMKKLNFNLPENDFLDDSIGKITAQKSFFKRIYLYLVICLTLGINIMYYDIFHEYDFAMRLNLHALYTILFTGLYFAGLRIRKNKYNRELQPLVDELNKIKKQIHINEEEQK